MKRTRLLRSATVEPPPLLSLRSYVSESKSAKVTVHGDELAAIFEAFAHANNYSIHELMGNVSVEAGKRLPCRILHRMPAEWSFMHAPNGYIRIKLKKSKCVRGHSFIGNDDSGPSYKPPASIVSASPKRAQPRRFMVSARPVVSESPELIIGATQPELVWLHRAACIACLDDPSVANQKWVLHCCGIKDCGVISHYRVGSVITNKKDELYHQRYRGKSLESHPPPQTRLGRPD